jgi:hypothetical protein
MDPEFLSLRSTDGKDSRVHRGSLGCLVASHDRYNRFKAGHPGGFIEAFANMYADIAEMLAINSLESDEHGTESQRYVFDVENSATVTDLLSKATAAARSQTWLDVTDRE